MLEWIDKMGDEQKQKKNILNNKFKLEGLDIFFSLRTVLTN